MISDTLLIEKMKQIYSIIILTSLLPIEWKFANLITTTTSMNKMIQHAFIPEAFLPYNSHKYSVPQTINIGCDEPSHIELKYYEEFKKIYLTSYKLHLEIKKQLKHQENINSRINHIEVLFKIN